jgi:type IV pilus assembly protein PilX
MGAPMNKLLRQRGPRGQQRGVVLLVVLVVLALMLLAGFGVMRAVDTSNVVAGNFSFQQAAVQASDRGLTDAMNALPALVTGGAGNTAVANRYYTTIQTPVDARGVPTGIDWSAVSCSDWTGAAVTNCATETGNYRIQYVIERRCTAAPNLGSLGEIRGQCEYEPSATALSPTSIGVRYRVIVRVRGPRGTDTYVESMVSGPATR